MSADRTKRHTSALEILRTQSLTSVVQQEIERIIWDGKLQPKARVNEMALAGRFGVSRGPIREACRALAAMGLLEVTPSRGFSVRSLDAKDVAELYEARAGLCGFAGTLLAERLADADFKRLEAMVDKMDRVADAGDVERYYRLNLEFHHALIALTGNERLTQIYDGVVKQLHLCRIEALSQAGALVASNAEHRRIVKTLKTQDAQRAFTVMSDHVKASHGRMLAVMSAVT